ncbi:M20/M25/M40 family metallo-hydrolase [Methylobacterium sp. SyP6R]|uniref:M20/M25/M40 family metallo-hydrolase n=1 Tax=Methylobacterium sp. SyP6R TaxID=2718876 RepID=UPI001F28F678|nr:M20/M25/M40 family metallo-hydrolase [Methylobacterium sp. SyP6R]MCF4124143.1 M20/M25/M40 family metallo-hydrolase [Methylobacterium sp. SyP6R]
MPQVPLIPGPADLAPALDRLRRLVLCETPSYAPDALAAGLALMRAELGADGLAMSDPAPDLDAAGAVRARYDRGGALTGPPILILGHLDTVHPVGELAANPWRIEGSRAFGPGILDMKGGIVLALEALRRAGPHLARPVEILITSDEEIGSPRSRGLIEARAKAAACVLVPEPARDNGGLVVGRHAILRYALSATGRPAHAGRDPAKGDSAIHRLARAIVALESRSVPGASLGVGVIGGGTWVNCVPEHASAEMLCVAADDARRAEIAGIVAAEADERLAIDLASERPLWRTGTGDRALYEAAQAVAAALGVVVSPEVSGGGSDGNFTGALGVPTLDGLGPCGAGLHAHDEHLDLASLGPRIGVMANLLVRVGGTA